MRCPALAFLQAFVKVYSILSLASCFKADRATIKRNALGVRTHAGVYNTNENCSLRRHGPVPALGRGRLRRVDNLKDGPIHDLMWSSSGTCPPRRCCSTSARTAPQNVVSSNPHGRRARSTCSTGRRSTWSARSGRPTARARRHRHQDSGAAARAVRRRAPRRHVSTAPAVTALADGTTSPTPTLAGAYRPRDEHLQAALHARG